MKAKQRRLFLLGGLLLFALLWVFLMSLGDVRSGSATATDGATAEITRVNSEGDFPNINTHLLVRDAAGEPLPSLPKTAFTVWEDGIPVPVTNFVGAGGQVVSTLLVIDRSGSMEESNKMSGAQEAAQLFVSLARPDQDYLGLLIFDHSLEVVSPLGQVTTGSKTELEREIERIEAEGGTAFYDAVSLAIEEMAGAEGRALVIALTDGQDTDSDDWVDDVIGQAQEALVPVYAVGLGQGEEELNRTDLTRLAEETGGRYFETPNPDELVAWYGSLANELQNEYVLSYTSPTVQLDGTQREVAIEIAYPQGTLSVSEPYAVAGLIQSGINYPLFAVVFLLLLGLLAVPSLLSRFKRQKSDPLPSISPPINPPAPSIPSASTLPPPVALPPTSAPMMPSPAPKQASVPPVQKPVSTLVMPDAALPQATTLPRLVRIIPLSKESALIGSGAEATLRLQIPGIAPKHAYVGIERGRYVISDLSGERQTLVSFNGDPKALRPVSKNALKDGTLIRLGRLMIEFRQSGREIPWLEIQHDLPAAGGTIGSGAHNDLIVTHASISRQHAELRLLEGRWVIRDLESSQGTFVSYSGAREQEHRVQSNALKEGSMVRIGELEFEFRVE